MKRIIILLTFILTAAITNCQVQHMLGYVDLREACIWARTEEPGQLTISFSKKGEPGKQRTLAVATLAENSNCCHLFLSDLEPGATYEYSLKSNNRNEAVKEEKKYEFTTQQLWQYRMDAPDFRMALGSCTFINEEIYDRPGKPYGGDYGIFDTIVSKDPDLMLWLGDNIYLREVDFNSRAGIAHRYIHSRSVPQIQNLMHHCANYAIWDDHDFGPNDGDASYIHKDWTLDAFKSFWANPSYGLPGKCDANGITTQFSYNDIDFFLMDNRYNRVNIAVKNAGSPTILGEDQINWLIQSLKFSKAPFKLIAMGGQFLNPLGQFENYSTYPEERQRIIDLIEINKITGVVFVTGDRHSGELSELKLKDGNVIYDLTVSPLTSTVHDISKEENALRVENSVTSERHFALLDFKGKKADRKMVISVYDKDGKLHWTKTIDATK